MATTKAPGRNHRDGISLVQLFKLFPDDEAAEDWFVQTRWPNGVACHYCGSTNVLVGAAHKTMPYRCREKDCRKRFSVRTGTVMQSSKLGFQVWAIACYLMSVNLKGISSMKLHRELSVTQKSAWHLAHRLRTALIATDDAGFTGPVEVDEAHIGGKYKNMHAKRRKTQPQKVVVVGARDRETKKVRAAVAYSQTGPGLQGFVHHVTNPDETQVYTDESPAYKGLPNHESVNHSVGEYVKGQASTNGMESFWATLKRGYVGVYHRMSEEHLPKYIGEFEGRHNNRDLDTIDQMREIVRGSEGKQLKYKELIRHPHGGRAVAI